MRVVLPQKALAVAVLPDGNKFLSGSVDKTVSLWDITSGKLECSYSGDSGHKDFVSSVAPLPDGEHFLSGSYDKTIILWNYDGTVKQTFTGHTDLVYSVVPLPSEKNNEFLSTSADKTVIKWNIADGSPERVFHGHTQRVTSVAPLPKKQTNDAMPVALPAQFLTGSADHSIILWIIDHNHKKQGGIMRAFEGHKGEVLTLAVLDEHRFLSGSEDRSIILWTIADGCKMRIFKGHSGFVLAMALLPDGSQFLSCSADKTIVRWNLDDGTQVNSYVGEVGISPTAAHTKAVLSLAALPNGQRFVSCSDDKTIRVIKVAQRGHHHSHSGGEGRETGSTPFDPPPHGLRSRWHQDKQGQQKMCLIFRKAGLEHKYPLLLSNLAQPPPGTHAAPHA